nr:MAG: putative capsid protein [Picobirnavirus sp.]
MARKTHGGRPDKGKSFNKSSNSSQRRSGNNESKSNNAKGMENRGDSKESQNSSDASGQTETNNGKGSADSRTTSTTNDPAWYGVDPRLVLDAASVPFSEPYGSKIDLRPENVPMGLTSITPRQSAISGTALSIPGLCVLDTLPAYGSAVDRLSPLNVAATALYSQVRYVNNGRKNYDPADLMLYVASVAELYSFLNWVRRIYAMAFIYSQSNRFVGKALLQASGINPDDVVSNLANLRYWINVYTNKISSYAVPADITLFFKRAFQFNAVYIEHEGDSIKDQLYFYRPCGFYKFRLDDASRGMLELRYINYPAFNNQLSVQDIINIGEDLLANIWADEDFGLMSGDVLKAFDGKILTLSELPPDYTLPVVFDKAVLTQIENSTVQGVLVEDFKDQANITRYYTIPGDTWKFQPAHVYQDKYGNLVSHWMMIDTIDYQTASSASSLYPRCQKLINIHEPAGDPAMVIESIQNMTFSKPNSQFSLFGPTGEVYADLEVGATVVFQVRVHYYAEQNGNTVLVADHVSQAYNFDPNTGYFNNYSSFRVAFASFKYLPKLFRYAVVGTELTTINPISNLDTYALIENTQLSRMQEVSLLSLLYVPGVAKFANSIGGER